MVKITDGVSTYRTWRAERTGTKRATARKNDRQYARRERIDTTTVKWPGRAALQRPGADPYGRPITNVRDVKRGNVASAPDEIPSDGGTAADGRCCVLPTYRGGWHRWGRPTIAASIRQKIIFFKYSLERDIINTIIIILLVLQNLNDRLNSTL